MVAERRGTLAVIIEKDFWVVWTLKHLFALDPRPPFIFKGGTSLSKAFGIIERFSEDIDLIVDRGYFGFEGPLDITAAPSRTKRLARLEEVRQRVADFNRAQLLPSLEARFSGILSELARLEVDAGQGETLHFYYPTDLQHDYIRPRVTIEMGGNADNWPTVAREVRPYLQEEAACGDRRASHRGHDHRRAANAMGEAEYSTQDSSPTRHRSNVGAASTVFTALL